MTNVERMGRVDLMDYCHLRFNGRRHTIYPRRRVFPAGFAQKFCRHDFSHIWYCLSGHYTHYVEEDTYECGPGSIVIIPPGVEHAFEVPEGTDADLMYVDLGYDIFIDQPSDRYVNTVANLFLHCHAKDLGHPLPLFTQLSNASCQHFQEYFSRFALIWGDMEAERLQLMENMETLMTVPELAIPEHIRPKAIRFVEQRLKPVMQAVRYCNSHYGEKIYLEDLLRVSTLCQTNFLRLFKLQFGVSSSSYIQMLRTSHARVLLGASTFSLSYISDICGFSNASHMVNNYNKYCGMSPKIGRQVMTEFWNRKTSVKPRISRD